LATSTLRWMGPPPWTVSTRRRWSVQRFLDGGSGKATELDALCADAVSTVRRKGQGSRWTIYTDGSAVGGISDGGSAAVATSGDALNPLVLQIRRRRGALRTNSYETEVAALSLALDWCEQVEDGPALICTDSQALLRALTSGPANDCEMLGTVRRRLTNAERDLSLQWVPGHCGLPGNERADFEAGIAAGRGATVDEEGLATVAPADLTSQLSFGAAKARLKEECLEERHRHPRVMAVYGTDGWKPVVPDTGRKDQVLIAQLRAGHCARLAAYGSIVNPEADAICPRCQEEAQDLEHWLQRCPALEERRRNIFGCASPPLSVLSRHPSRVLTYASQSI
jgi:ribonuclease HI